MITITFATGNIKKVQSAQEILKSYGIQVLQEKIETPEIQGKDIRKVAEYSAKFAGDLLKKPVIKVDVGFEIEALDGFPGPFLRFINEWLSPEKILKLMEGELNRKAKFIDVVAYSRSGIKPLSFVVETPGKIANKPAGSNGWGIDTIFIPQGYRVPLATLTDEERVKVWNKDHWIQLAHYLQKKG